MFPPTQSKRLTTSSLTREAEKEREKEGNVDSGGERRLFLLGARYSQFDRRFQTCAESVRVGGERLDQLASSSNEDDIEFKTLTHNKNKKKDE